MSTALVTSHDWKCLAGECRIQAWPSLHEMSQVISQRADLAEIVQILLHIMEKYMCVVRGTVSLCDRNAGTIYIHESFGLTEEQEARGIYRFGEGITGKVVESGETMILQRIGDDKDFLNLTRTRTDQDDDLSFICVPIKRGNKVLGTISVERIYDNDVLLNLDVELIGIVATMMAQAVELYLVENVDKASLLSENQRLQDALKERYRPSNIIGNCKSMREVYNLIEKVAKTKTTILILGESGVGKELVASAIHYSGFNPNGPFVQFNCAALPENLIESELFGHEKGSFTGATNFRKGRFEEADGGTIFLDEVGELPLAAQAKLLRVLQEKTLERVGTNKPIKVDIRIVAATNRNLEEMVANREFREDLYYRLNVFPMTIPPLRERGADIIALADYFVARYAKQNGKDVKRISTPALNMLMSYHWPGNVRELENVIERATILSEGGVIHGYDLPPSLQTPVLSGTAQKGAFDARMAAYGYEMIVDALKTQDGNMTEAARELGLPRRVLGLRMKEYGMNYKDYRIIDKSKE
ncbi:sigma-54 interaction domain-containing protein [Telmatobacter bradus]|uniref:sigma-54 interaction domain-containing protein n=1 Tax=Telmatobacter bradus TaxID=474953 RepID=UPI003B42C890